VNAPNLSTKRLH